MKEIKLSQGKIALVDDDRFEELNKFTWHARQSRNTLYAFTSKTINGKRKFIAMHRLVLGVKDSSILVDHKNGNGLDNQTDNLRTCTNVQNIWNSKSRPKSGSKYKGVCWHKKNQKWRADIRANGSQMYLGLFVSEEEAARKYNEMAIIHHGEFAYLNKIP